LNSFNMRQRRKRREKPIRQLKAEAA
jgi:hypothetical protein